MNTQKFNLMGIQTHFSEAYQKLPDNWKKLEGLTFETNECGILFGFFPKSFPCQAIGIMWSELEQVWVYIGTKIPI